MLLPRRGCRFIRAPTRKDYPNARCYIHRDFIGFPNHQPDAFIFYQHANPDSDDHGNAHLHSIADRFADTVPAADLYFHAIANADRHTDLYAMANLNLYAQPDHHSLPHTYGDSFAHANFNIDTGSN
jgi:hypothetical protein